MGVAFFIFLLYFHNIQNNKLRTQNQSFLNSEENLKNKEALAFKEKFDFLEMLGSNEIYKV